MEDFQGPDQLQLLLLYNVIYQINFMNKKQEKSKQLMLKKNTRWLHIYDRNNKNTNLRQVSRFMKKVDTLQLDC